MSMWVEEEVQEMLRRGDGELSLRLPVFRLLTRSASGERLRELHQLWLVYTLFTDG